MSRPTSSSKATALGVEAKLIVLALLAAVLVFVPTPRVEAAETMVIETRTPALAPAPAPTGTVTAQSTAGADVAAELREPGRTIASEQVTRFDLLGVTVPTAPTAHFLARARVDGRWTPWMSVEISSDHRPEGRERAAGAQRSPGAHSDPVWFGDADAYEVSVPAGVRAIQVHLVRPTVQSMAVGLAEPSAAAATGSAAPPILTRSQWGAREPAVPPGLAPDLKLAVVHHSVNANTYTREDVPALLRGIQRYHMDVNGWDDIAYNFAVDRFGRIWEARAGGVTKDVIGGHAQGFNTYSTGVMVLGDFTSAEPSQAAVNAVADVIGWKFARHQIDVRGTTQFASGGSPRYASGTVVQLPRIVGHRDVGVTGCPGSRLYARMAEIRLRAAAQFDHYLTTQPETPLFGDFDGDGLRDILRYRPGATADVLWSHPGGTNRQTSLVIDGTYRPVVADLDGDGRDDILWYGPGSTPGDRVWYGGPAGFTSRVVDLPEHGLPEVAELDGDGIDDVVIYAPGGAPDRIYSGRPDRTLVALPLGVDLTYDLSVGDFDGDGRDDLLWFGYGVRDSVRTFSEGNGQFIAAPVAIDAGDTVPVIGDFDGDGLDDLLLYGPGTSADEMWWSESEARGAITVEPIQVKGATYQPQVGDVNGDGRDDVFWYQPGPGADPLWGWPSGPGPLRTRAQRRWRLCPRRRPLLIRCHGRHRLGVPVLGELPVARLRRRDLPVGHARLTAPRTRSGRECVEVGSNYAAPTKEMPGRGRGWTLPAQEAALRTWVASPIGSAPEREDQMQTLRRLVTRWPRPVVRLVAGSVAVALLLGAAATTGARPAGAEEPISETITVTGRGWGHGRGLGQWGAFGYATGRSGGPWSYRTILAHFYGDTQVGGIANPLTAVTLLDQRGQVLSVERAAGVMVDGLEGTSTAVRATLRPDGRYDVQRSIGCIDHPWSLPEVLDGPVRVRAPGTTGGADDVLRLCRPDGTTVGYRGELVAMAQSFDGADIGLAQTVNLVRLDDLLRSIVPAEVPPAWGTTDDGRGMQAVLAQAVAARGFVAAGDGRWHDLHSSLGASFTTCDTALCQRYPGVGVEHPVTDGAVRATSGEVRVRGTLVVRTEFTASSGGWTAGGTFPAVEDVGDAVAANPVHRWTTLLDRATIESEYALGRLVSMDVLERNGLGADAGRVLVLRLVGTATTVEVSGMQFRNDFGLRSDWFTISGAPPRPPVTAPSHHPRLPARLGARRRVRGRARRQRPRPRHRLPDLVGGGGGDRDGAVQPFARGHPSADGLVRGPVPGGQRGRRPHGPARCVHRRRRQRARVGHQCARGARRGPRRHHRSILAGDASGSRPGGSDRGPRPRGARDRAAGRAHRRVRRRHRIDPRTRPERPRCRGDRHGRVRRPGRAAALDPSRPGGVPAGPHPRPRRGANRHLDPVSLGPEDATGLDRRGRRTPCSRPGKPGRPGGPRWRRLLRGAYGVGLVVAAVAVLVVRREQIGDLIAGARPLPIVAALALGLVSLAAERLLLDALPGQPVGAHTERGPCSRRRWPPSLPAMCRAACGTPPAAWVISDATVCRL